MLNNSPAFRLLFLYGLFQRVAPESKSDIQAWVDKAIPWIRRDWPDDVEDFRQLVKSVGRASAAASHRRIDNYLTGLLAASFIPVPGSLAPTKPVEVTESLKQFCNDYPDPSKVAFLMMRFGKTPAHNRIVKSIRSTLQPLGIQAVRADDKQYHPELWYNILTYLVGCGFGIAVFERIDQEDFNPNVALEVGYLYGVGKQVCLLKDKTLKSLHADIIGRLYCEFDPQDSKGTIPPPLKKWMSDIGIIVTP
jgi:hypothetical protein